jgi:hypothetical protein
MALTAAVTIPFIERHASNAIEIAGMAASIALRWRNA